MNLKTNRILMNEADASPGNGAAATSPATPAPTAAPTAPETPAVPAPDVNAIVEAKLKAFQNEFFANARKAGLLKKDEAPAPAAPPAPASTGLSLADVEAMLERERVLTRVATEHKLTDAQVKRMKSSLAAEKPDDVSTWVSSFVTDMGFVRPATESQPAAAPAQPAPSGPPLSDKGSPAPGGVVAWQREFAENPGFMSTAARAAMDAELGADVARRKRIDAVNRPGGQAERLRVATKG